MNTQSPHAASARTSEPASDNLDRIKHELTQARTKLLHLGLRHNNFLNYRILKSRGLLLANDSAERIDKLLKVEGKTFQVISTPEAEKRYETHTAKRNQAFANQTKQIEANTGLQKLSPELTQPGHANLRLGLNDYLLIAAGNDADLDKRLTQTARFARSYREERGINTLFLALGVLNWRESDNSRETLQAPLYLVPVTLRTANAPHGYQIAPDDGDVQGNLTLQEKLRRIGINIRMPEDDENVTSYLNSVSSEISRKSGWSVDYEHVSLGFFSFTRHLMYLDLNDENWPDDHPVLESLLVNGFDHEPDALEQAERLDDQPAYENLTHVLEADGSQSIAIAEALRSDALIIQGPPGTGKSQTITNLIAEAIAQDKKVLFVSEKLAALNVVKRRLDAIGLGDAALELHSDKASRTEIVRELERTLRLRSDSTVRKPSKTQLHRHRDELNEYVDALHTPIEDTGRTPYQLYGTLPSSKHIDAISLKSIGSTAPPPATMQQLKELTHITKDVEAWVQQHGSVADHPYREVYAEAILPSFERNWETLLQETKSALEAFLELRDDPLAKMFNPNLDTFTQPKEIADTAEEALVALDTRTRFKLSSIDWIENKTRILDLLKIAREAAQARKRYSDVVAPQAWQETSTQSHHLNQLHRTIVHGTGKPFYRWFNSDYKRAVTQVTQYLHTSSSPTHSNLLRALHALQENAKASDVINAEEALTRAIMPIDTDILIAADEIEAVLTYHDNSSSPESLNRLAALSGLGITNIELSIKHIRDLTAAAEQATNALIQELRLNNHPTTVSEWMEQLTKWIGTPNGLTAAASWARIRHKATTLNYGSLVAAVENGLKTNNLTQRITNGIYQDWLDQAFATRPALTRFEANTHNRHRDQFIKLDASRLTAHRQLIAAKHKARLPRMTGVGQTGLLLAEFKKKSRHLPIRRLMLEAAATIQDIKPVFMMSPLSVAVYLPRNAAQFDLVIFDEASQVRPADALGALMRGNAAIVVGDEQQLPPTNFFELATEDEELEHEHDSSTMSDMESVLGMFAAKGAKQRMLKWHYRSEHESLIAVSNKEFYDNDLLLFPSPNRDNTSTGIVFHHLPDTVYDNGGSRANRKEARAVAQAVLEHVTQHPDETLGVATFSISQANAVQLEVERLRREEPAFQSYDALEHNKREPFFIKNLENIQGDERDVIMISVGYGFNNNGRLLYNFGPLNNKEGGHRRLNVLISRARKRTEIFTNFTDEDMDPTKLNSRGISVFHKYMKYARTGILDTPDIGDREEDSPFEQAVRKALEARGHMVHPQVGQAGYFIDLAIAHPTKPGQMVLGIECDGATYHSSRSAQERDRLRQSHLESMGWRIHRIWSTDWFRNPEAALEAAEAAIAEAIAYYDAPATTADKEPPTPPVLPTRTDDTAQNFQEPEPLEPEAVLEHRKYETAAFKLQPEGDLHAVPTARLTRWLNRIITVEGPVHPNIAARRLASNYGTTRIGKRIQSAIANAIDHGVNTGKFTLQHDDSLTNSSTQARSITLRNRSHLHGDDRKIENVPTTELNAGIKQILSAAHGVTAAELIQEIAAQLGYDRVTQQIRGSLNEHLKLLESKKLLTWDPATDIIQWSK